ncbi:AraC family transcriptional regulator [Vallitaleaceae bacterium 9-2]
MNLNVLKDSSEIIYYNNPSIPIYVKKSNLSSFTHKEALCHWHEDVEFLIPVKGHISYNINGQNIIVNKDEAIWVNSRQMHYGFSNDYTDCDYICLVFNPKTLFTLLSVQQQYVTPVLECSITELIIKADNELSRNLLNSIRQLYHLYEFEPTNIELKAMSLLYQIWEYLFLLLKPYFPQDLSKYDSNLTTMKQMLSFIYNNYDSKISLSDIAMAANIGKSKCCKLFKQYLNHSPNQYLNSYRLDKSILLLRDSTLTITDVAFACGYSNPSYFSEIFIKFKGCTPSEYRSKYNSLNIT